MFGKTLHNYTIHCRSRHPLYGGMFAIMMEKSLFNRIAQNIRVGAVDVTYWDGETKHYGQGDSRFRFIINHPRAVRAILRNMTVGFGESYMKGDIEIEGSIIDVGRIVSENTSGFNNLALNR